MSTKKRRAIDYHCNLFTPEAVKRKYVKSGEGNEDFYRHGRHTGRLEGYTVPEFLSLMEELGIEKGVVPAWQWRSFIDGTMLWDDSPQLIHETLGAYSDRFFGLYGINPFKRMEGVRELERVVKEYGFKGVHLHTHGYGLPLNHRDYYPFWAKCERIGYRRGDHGWCGVSRATSLFWASRRFLTTSPSTSLSFGSWPPIPDGRGWRKRSIWPTGMQTCSLAQPATRPNSAAQYGPFRK